MATAAAGSAWTDLLLNAIFRGSVGTPPATIYLSLGQETNAVTQPVEISGVTRTAVKACRGLVNGQDGHQYQYQSSGTAAVNYINFQRPIDIYCTGLGANSYNNPTFQLWDAASAGNLLLSSIPGNSNEVPQVVNGDIVRPFPSAVFVDNSQAYPHNVYGTVAMHVGAGTYMKGIVNDWLLRGIDSINQLFPVATFPNVYANFSADNGFIYTTVPRLAIPRNTSTWSAPADVNAGVILDRKITNSVALTFAAATGPGNATPNGLHLEFRMSNTPQSFDDLIYSIPCASTVSWATGDQLQLAIGACDIVWG